MIEHRGYLTGTANLSMALFGIIIGTIGATLPVIISTFGLSLSQAGTLLAADSFGYLLSVMACGYLADRYSKKGILSVGVGWAVVALFCFGRHPAFWLNVFLMFLMGWGAGSMEIVLNALIIDLYTERRANVLSFLHLFFGAGAFVGPRFAGYILSQGYDWRYGYIGAGGLGFLLLLAFLAQRFPEVRSPSQERRVRAITLCKERLLLLLGVILALYVGAEMGVGKWMTTYLESERSTSISFAADGLSLYWIGLTLGRLILSRISHRFEYALLIQIMNIGTFLSLSAAILVPHSTISVIFFALTGLFFSGVYPIAMAIAGSSFPEYSATAASILATGGAVGSMIFPWSMSWISERTNLTVGMGFYVLLAILMIGVTRIVTSTELETRSLSEPQSLAGTDV